MLKVFPLVLMQRFVFFLKMTLFFYRNLLLISSQIKTFIAVVPFFQTYTLSVLKTQNFIPQEESEMFIIRHL